jgi:predicted acetyltransferase
MIISGENQYIPALKAMWKLCFPTDANAFIAFYFDEIYKNEDSLIYLEREKPVAALQIISYPIKINHTIHLGGYISGAMTHPDYRHKGYMEELLKAAISVMQSRDFVYSFLIPQEEWLFDFYEKYAYVRAFPINGEKIISDFTNFPINPFILRDKSIQIYKQQDEVNLADFYITYSRFLMEKPNVVLKSKQQTVNILWDFFDEKGILFANDWGIAFTFFQEERVFIKEFFYFDEEIKGEFLKKISEYYQNKEITICNDSSTPFLKYQGMIKRLDESDVVSTGIYMSMMLN